MNKTTKREINFKDTLWDILETMSKDYNMSREYLIEVAINEFAHSKGYLELPKNKDKNKVKKLEDSLLNKKPNDNKKSDDQKDLELPVPPQKPKKPKDSIFDKPEKKVTPPKPQAPKRGKSKPKTPPMPPVNSEPKLMIEYNNELTEVNKNKFVIGRSSQADLRITENPSISRKHALVVQKNGKFYIKDLGSINGTEYKGKKIDLRLISDGDVFTICDIPIVFKLQK